MTNPAAIRGKISFLGVLWYDLIVVAVVLEELRRGAAFVE